MEMQWVDTTDQQRLCVKTYGQPTRPALVLVHGYPDHQAVWELVIAYLSQDYFVVSYDVRGAGESSIPQKNFGLPPGTLKSGSGRGSEQGIAESWFSSGSA